MESLDRIFIAAVLAGLHFRSGSVPALGDVPPGAAFILMEVAA
jgi:hypothetical protein